MAKIKFGKKKSSKKKIPEKEIDDSELDNIMNEVDNFIKEEKPKEECPFCGRQYKHLRKHRCAQDPSNQVKFDEIEIPLVPEKKEKNFQEIHLEQIIISVEDILNKIHNLEDKNSVKSWFQHKRHGAARSFVVLINEILAEKLNEVYKKC